MPEKRWFILAFRPCYDVLEDIVGGDQVRPFELFNAYAKAGHRVHIWETDGASAGERSFHGGSLIVRPLRHSFGILSALPQYLEMRKVLQDEVKQARKDGFENLCYYNQVPAAIIFRFRTIPMLTQPGILLFDLARRSGIKVWGNLHDLSPDHELSMHERIKGKVKMRHVRMQAAIHAWLQKTFVRKVDYISAASVGMKEALIERYSLPSDRISVMQAGYNPGLVQDIEPWVPPAADRGWTIGYLGSPMDASLEVVVQALNQLGRPETRLLLAGRGMTKAANCYKDLWSNIEIREGVRYSSFSKIANEVDLWVVPLTDTFSINYVWQLKMPMYLASGRPIVRTEGKALDDSGLRDCFFKTGSSPSDMAATIASVLDHPDEALSKAQQALEAVTNRITWKDVAADLLTGLEKAAV